MHRMRKKKLKEAKCKTTKKIAKTAKMIVAIAVVTQATKNVEKIVAKNVNGVTKKSQAKKWMIT